MYLEPLQKLLHVIEIGSAIQNIKCQFLDQFESHNNLINCILPRNVAWCLSRCSKMWAYSSWEVTIPERAKLYGRKGLQICLKPLMFNEKY